MPRVGKQGLEPLGERFGFLTDAVQVALPAGPIHAAEVMDALPPVAVSLRLRRRRDAIQDYGQIAGPADRREDQHGQHQNQDVPEQDRQSPQHGRPDDHAQPRAQGELLADQQADGGPHHAPEHPDDRRVVPRPAQPEHEAHYECTEPERQEGGRLKAQKKRFRSQQ